MIAFKCPTCGKEYAVKDESGGKKTTCRVCKTRMVIPDAVGLPTSAGVAPGAGNDQAVPGKVRAITYMVLAGGIFALFWFFVECLLSLAFCFCFIPGIYSLIVGLVATIKGAQLLAANRYRHPPPRATAVMLIINAVNLDPVGVVLGVLTLILLKDPEVEDYYSGG